MLMFTYLYSLIQRRQSYTRKMEKLTIKDAMKRLGVSRVTALSYLHSGKLVGHKENTIGLKKQWIIYEKDLQAFIDEYFAA